MSSLLLFDKLDEVKNRCDGKVFQEEKMVTVDLQRANNSAALIHLVDNCLQDVTQGQEERRYGTHRSLSHLASFVSL